MSVKQKQLPIAVLERIVQASRQIAESYHSNYARGTWTEKESGRILAYAEYEELRYRTMVAMLASDATEEQIAVWDLSIDKITRKHLHFVPIYNLLWQQERKTAQQ